MITLGILEVGAISLLFYYIIRHNSQKKIQYIELSSDEYNQILPYLNNVRQSNDNLVPPPYQNTISCDDELIEINSSNSRELQPPEYSITNSNNQTINNTETNTESNTETNTETNNNNGTNNETNNQTNTNINEFVV